MNRNGGPASSEYAGLGSGGGTVTGNEGFEGLDEVLVAAPRSRNVAPSIQLTLAAFAPVAPAELTKDVRSAISAGHRQCMEDCKKDDEKHVNAFAAAAAGAAACRASGWGAGFCAALTGTASYIAAALEDRGTAATVAASGYVALVDANSQLITGRHPTLGSLFGGQINERLGGGVLGQAVGDLVEGAIDHRRELGRKLAIGARTILRDSAVTTGAYVAAEHAASTASNLHCSLKCGGN